MMKMETALWKGAAVWGGLVLAQTAWAQGTMPTPGPASAGQAGQAGPVQASPGAASPGQPGMARTGGARTGRRGAAQAGRGRTAPGGAAVTPGQVRGTAAPAAVPGGPVPVEKIAQITILGNKNVSTDAVRAVLTEKVGDVFSAQTAEKDRQAVSALGYWSTAAQLAELTDPKGGVDLTFSVVENPVVQSIRFNANTLTGEPTIPSATLLALMQTRPGQVLNANTLQSDLGTLFGPGTGYADRQGYQFRVGSSLSIDPKTGVLTVPVIETYVQAVQVTGNGRTPDTDIVRALPVQAGELYNSQTVRARLASFPGTSRFRVAGPPTVEPVAPGRVVLTVPVTGRK